MASQDVITVDVSSDSDDGVAVFSDNTHDSCKTIHYDDDEDCDLVSVISCLGDNIGGKVSHSNAIDNSSGDRLHNLYLQHDWTDINMSDVSNEEVDQNDVNSEVKDIHLRMLLQDEINKHPLSKDKVCLNCKMEVPSHVVLQCTSGHSFCQQCFRNHTIDCIVKNEKNFVTCIVSGCNSSFGKDLVRAIVANAILGAYERVMCAEYTFKDHSVDKLIKNQENQNAVLLQVLKIFPDVNVRHVLSLLPLFGNCDINTVKILCAHLKNNKSANYKVNSISNSNSNVSNSIQTLKHLASQAYNCSVNVSVDKSLPCDLKLKEENCLDCEHNIPDEIMRKNISDIQKIALPNNNKISNELVSHINVLSESISHKEILPVFSLSDLINVRNENSKESKNISFSSSQSNKRTNSEVLPNNFKKHCNTVLATSKVSALNDLLGQFDSASNSVDINIMQLPNDKDSIKSYILTKCDEMQKECMVDLKTISKNNLSEKVLDSSRNLNNLANPHLSENKPCLQSGEDLAIPGPSGISASNKEKEGAEDDYECQCCYNNVPFDYLVQCMEAHLFCCECLKKYTEECVFGQGQATLQCMTDGCTASFAQSQLKRALPEKLMKTYEERIAEESLNLAGLENFVRCPYCKFGAVLGEENTFFQCQDLSCRKVTCRYCKVDRADHEGLKCDEIETKNDTDIRTLYEEKMATAKIRECPSCKAKFTKESGCNKITCRCGKSMCYICREPIKGYNHFCQHPRDPQKPCSVCSACFLWSNTEEDDRRAIAEIQQQAKKVCKIKDKEIGAPNSPEGDEIHKFLQIISPYRNFHREMLITGMQRRGFFNNRKHISRNGVIKNVLQPPVPQQIAVAPNVFLASTSHTNNNAVHNNQAIIQATTSAVPQVTAATPSVSNMGTCSQVNKTVIPPANCSFIPFHNNRTILPVHKNTALHVNKAISLTHVNSMPLQLSITTTPPFQNNSTTTVPPAYSNNIASPINIGAAPPAHSNNIASLINIGAAPRAHNNSTASQINIVPAPPSFNHAIIVKPHVTTACSSTGGPYFSKTVSQIADVSINYSQKTLRSSSQENILASLQNLSTAQLPLKITVPSSPSTTTLSYSNTIFQATNLIPKRLENQCAQTSKSLIGKKPNFQEHNLFEIANPTFRAEDLNSGSNSNHSVHNVALHVTKSDERNQIINSPLNCNITLPMHASTQSLICSTTIKPTAASSSK